MAPSRTSHVCGIDSRPNHTQRETTCSGCGFHSSNHHGAFSLAGELYIQEAALYNSQGSETQNATLPSGPYISERALRQFGFLIPEYCIWV